MADRRRDRVGETTQDKIDSAISAVLAETQTISSLKDEQRTILKDFLAGKDVFALIDVTPNFFGLTLRGLTAPPTVWELTTE